jgi:hypothetical protein
VSSHGFWALIAVAIFALFAGILALARWRLSAKPSVTSATVADTSSLWLASDTRSKLNEMCVDAENPLWDSDHDVTLAVIEVMREDEML